MRAGDSFAQWLRIAEPYPLSLLQYIPELRFPTFYVTLLYRRDVCGSWRSLIRARASRADPSNPIRISRACARQKWPISTDRCCSRAKSTLSHTPMLSLNCFGKALTYRKHGLKSRGKEQSQEQITGLRRESRTRDPFFVFIILDDPNALERFSKR